MAAREPAARRKVAAVIPFRGTQERIVTGRCCGTLGALSPGPPVELSLEVRLTSTEVGSRGGPVEGAPWPSSLIPAILDISP
jgi:hypothetical protein